MTRVLLSLGSNTDNPSKQLARAVKHIDHLRHTRIVSTSSVIVTAPWGKTDQPDFLNMALLIETTATVGELMEDILVIELKMGRIREEKWGPRKIDIDIILFGDLVVTSSFVTVPHPHMHERRFVLEPACEIAPKMMHPVLSQSIAELYRACPDKSVVSLSE